MEGKPPPDDPTNYLAEMIGHPASVSGLLASITAGAILSVALGLGPAAIPVVLFLGVQAMAALFVPGSPVFREYVDRRRRAERRDELRQHLTKRIQERAHRLEAWDALDDYERRYKQMRERLVSLAKIAASGSEGGLSAYDLERLDDATIDYLRLIYARLILRERMQTQDADEIRRQIRDIDRQIENVGSMVDRKRLEQAQADLERLLSRRAALPAKEAAANAQMLMMADAFEEIYHRVTTDPTSTQVGEYLREATERLSIEEELAMQVDEELGAITRRTRVATRN